jgi:hypothetical protein
MKWSRPALASATVLVAIVGCGSGEIGSKFDPTKEVSAEANYRRPAIQARTGPTGLHDA